MRTTLDRKALRTVDREDVAVIGGGPAGCAAAYGFMQHGHNVTIYEANQALGGRTFTHREAGFELDTGAAFVTNFYPRIAALGKTLGFSSSRRELQRITGLYHQGKVAHLNIASVLSFSRFPFIGWKDKIKMSAWAAGLTLQRARLDLADPVTLAPRDHRSVGDMARQVLSPDIYDFLVRPGIEPFWYFSCEEVSAALVEALTAHAAGARFFYFSGGIDQISQALAKNAHVMLNTPVLALEITDDGVEVTTQKNGVQTSRQFARAVIATPASTALKLAKELPDCAFSPSQRQYLSTQRYAANIHIAYRVPEITQLSLAGSIFPCGPGRHPLAAFSFHRIKSSRPRVDGDELVSVYLSDPESQRLMDADDQVVIERGWALAKEVYPSLPSDAECFYLIRRREAIPIHEVGRYRAAADFQAEQRAQRSRVTFCGDYLTTATVEGAVASGFAVADDS